MTVVPRESTRPVPCTRAYAWSPRESHAVLRTTGECDHPLPQPPTLRVLDRRGTTPDNVRCSLTKGRRFRPSATLLVSTIQQSGSDTICELRRLGCGRRKQSSSIKCGPLKKPRNGFGLFAIEFVEVDKSMGGVSGLAYRRIGLDRIRPCVPPG